MHWHPIQQEPGHTQAYCDEHAPEAEAMSECWSEDHVCCVCEEADDQ
jgi:hypothetical protein